MVRINQGSFRLRAICRTTGGGPTVLLRNGSSAVHAQDAPAEKILNATALRVVCSVFPPISSAPCFKKKKKNLAFQRPKSFFI
jgi:hypothetical protein